MCTKFCSLIENYKNVIFWSLFSLGLLFLIFLQYYGLVHYHYPVPPGHDAAMHYNTINYFFNGQYGLWASIRDCSYPPAFLVATATLAHWFNTDSLTIMLWTTPAIIIFAALAIFFLTKKIFGNKTALIAFFLYSFATNINIQQLNDGGYPSLIASQILLPLFFLFLISIFNSKKISTKVFWLIFALIILILIPYTHHLTTLYLMATLAIFLPVMVIYFWIKNKWLAIKGIGLLFILAVIYGSLIFVMSKISLFTWSLSLFSSTFRFDTIFPYFHIIGQAVPEAVVGWRFLPSYIGYSILFFGSIGIVALPIIYAKSKASKFLPTVAIVIWAAILLIGSQLGFLSNPDRLARDSVLPLAILAAALISFVLSWSWRKNRFVFVITLLIFLFLSLIPFRHRLINALRYEPMVRITQADIEAINYLKTQPERNILIEAYSFYFERFLPEKNINYLWASQTEQPLEFHLLNPNIHADYLWLEKFDFIYVVEQQQGWVPAAVQLGGAENYFGNPSFKQVGHYISETNEVYIFRVLH